MGFILKRAVEPQKAQKAQKIASLSKISRTPPQFNARE
jgi:hypothetical protein